VQGKLAFPASTPAAAGRRINIEKEPAAAVESLLPRDEASLQKAHRYVQVRQAHARWLPVFLHASGSKPVCVFLHASGCKPVCADKWLRPDTGGSRWSVWHVLQKAPTHNWRCTFPGTLIDPHRGRFCGAEGGTRRSSQAGTRSCKPRAIRQAPTAFSTRGRQARTTRHAHSTVTKPAAKAAQRGCHGGHARGRRSDCSVTIGFSSRAQIQFSS
jgi:hypothetical protein